MAKVNQKKRSKNISMNIDANLFVDINETYDFIDKFLPHHYSQIVINLLPDGVEYSANYIVSVKTKRIKSPIITSLLYHIAQFNKIQKQ